jgi:phycocyanobilin lyase alpha subunit
MTDYPTGSEMATDTAVAQPLTLPEALANMTAEDVSLRYYAAWWLGKFAQPSPEVIDCLLTALVDEDDRTALGGYPLRRQAARALGDLKSREAVGPLIASLDCEDYYVREAAVISLGMIGCPSAVPRIMQLLAGGVARIQMVPGRPHLSEPVEGAISALAKLGAQEAIALIEPFLNYAIDRVKYAAAKAMYILTQEPQYAEMIINAIPVTDIKLRRVLLMDLGASGYLPGATTIAQAPVENSFKLIALKSLAEQQLLNNSLGLTPQVREVMELMDALL